MMLSNYIPGNKNVRYGLLAALTVAVVIIVVVPSVLLSDADDVSKEMKLVHQVLRETPLIDTHNDLPWQLYKQFGNRLGTNVIDLNKNTTNVTHTDVVKLRAGRVGALFFAAFYPCSGQYKDAVEGAITQIDTIRRLVDEYSDTFEMAHTAEDVMRIHKRGLIAALIGVEGGHMINSNLAVLRTLHHMGANYLTLTWSCHTPWSDCFNADVPANVTKHDQNVVPPISKGLSEFGKTVVFELNRLGMLVDLSHTSVATAEAAMRASKAPVIFSHSSVYAVCNHRRNVRDSTLKLLKRNNGVIMVTFVDKFVRCTEDYARANMSDVIAHLNHVKQLIGVEHVGLGADYDGASIVKDLGDVSAYPRLLEALVRDHAWTADDIAKLAGGNILRVLRAAEEVAAEMSVVSSPSEDMLDYSAVIENNANATDSSNCTCKTIQDYSKKKYQPNTDLYG